MIQLRPLSEENFQEHKALLITEYAREHVAAGNWQLEEAEEQSAQEIQRLLPEELATPGQHWLAIYDEELDRKVGLLWFAVNERRKPPTAFIYDFAIDEAYRRRGYGRLALLALEDKVREMGIDQIALHVFGHNYAARALYESVGYQG